MGGLVTKRFLVRLNKNDNDETEHETMGGRCHQAEECTGCAHYDTPWYRDERPDGA